MQSLCSQISASVVVNDDGQNYQKEILFVINQNYLFKYNPHCKTGCLQTTMKHVINYLLPLCLQRDFHSKITASENITVTHVLYTEQYVYAITELLVVLVLVSVRRPLKE